MSGRFDAVVIGAGPNGLTAAAALGEAGLRVLVLEERQELGGQARLVEIAPGFRAAPLGSHAGWVPRSVARGLKLDLARTHAAAPVSVVEPGRDVLSLWRDPRRAAEALAAHSARDGERWPAFVGRLHELAGFLASLYERAAPDFHTTGAREALALLRVGRRVRGLGRAGMTELMRSLPMPVLELVEDWFETPALRAAVAAGGIQGLRQGPRSGGTTFVLLHHLTGARPGAVRDAAWWTAGPDAFIRAAERTAGDRGVAIRTGAGVERIEVRDDAVAGVVSSEGEEIATDIVLSTADPVRTLLGMVDPVWLDPELLRAVRNIKLRGSTAVVAYGVASLPPMAGADAREVLSGVVSLTADPTELERAADAAKYGEVSERPHVELTSPTCRWPDSGLAPEGRHVLLATARWAPYHLRNGGRWDAARREALAESVTSAIDAALPGFSATVEHRRAFTPEDIEAGWGLSEGAASQGELTLDQILFMRPLPGLGHALPVRGLYLAGCGAHPGPGIAGGAGWLAAERALRDRRG